MIGVEGFLQEKGFLENTLLLSLKNKATMLNTPLHGLGFLGYRIFPRLIRVKKENLKKFKKKMSERERQYKDGFISEKKYVQSLSSLIEVIRFAQSSQLRKNILFGQRV